MWDLRTFTRVVDVYGNEIPPMPRTPNQPPLVVTDIQYHIDFAAHPDGTLGGQYAMIQTIVVDRG